MMLFGVSCLVCNAFAVSGLPIRSMSMSPDGKIIYAVHGQPYGPSYFLVGNNGNWTDKEIGKKEIIESVYGLADGTVYFGGYARSYAKYGNSEIKNLDRGDKNFDYGNISAISASEKAIFMGGDDTDDDGAWLFVNANGWFEPSLNNCTPDKLGPGSINSIAVGGDTVYLGVSNFGDAGETGVCMSEDSGKSWNQLVSFPEMDASAVFSSNDGNIVYAGNEHLSDSVDRGATWNDIDLGAKSDYVVNAIAGSKDGAKVYVGTSIGLWTNVSGAWQEIQYPQYMPHAVDALAISVDGNTVAAACRSAAGHSSIWVGKEVDQKITWTQVWPSVYN